MAGDAKTHAGNASAGPAFARAPPAKAFLVGQLARPFDKLRVPSLPRDERGVARASALTYTRARAFVFREVFLNSGRKTATA
jgi:hypothetical protein